MFEHPAPDASGRPKDAGPDAAAVAGWAAELADLGVVGDGAAEAELADRIRACEDLKTATAAAQARAAAGLDASRRRAEAVRGVVAGPRGRGLAAEIALARRESPARGGQLLGLAKAMVYEMPHTLAALAAGQLNEWRATLLVRETACLAVEDRRMVDEALAADPAMLEGMGDRKLAGEARRHACRLDPSAAVRRARKAETERHVSCRPAPDTMTWVTGLLPVAQGVAVYAALTREADRLRATGDERGRGQIMPDTLVERVTGRAAADGVRVEL
jgi:hypothetical protein